MPMKRPVFDVYLAGHDEPLRVEISHADMLVAEQSAPRYSIPASVDAAPMTWSTLWIWHALRRRGEYSGEWPAFKLQDCEGFEEPKGTEGGEDVDPTQPAAPTDSP